ncbi:MAG: MBL fold metallo-hydrolase [Rhizobacter sp.]|nr:MBL fold metallo-hydrolase [Bacteriovorax sp.]
MSCSSQSAYKLTDHYNGKIFYMPKDDTQPKGFLDLMKWKLEGNGEDWPDKVEPPVVQAIPAPAPINKMIVTFVNHSTFLIQVDGINILTDPIWSKRAGPFSFAGPKRVHEPGIAFEALPKIDAVIISHNHYDHMDRETIKSLEDKFSPKFIVPLANEEKMKSFGAKNVVELDWNDSVNISPEMKITLLQARHWSARTLTDKREALWGSYYIETKKEKIYFAGDTAYGTHFAEIEKKMGAPDLALLPIGAYEPRWFMKSEHMNPEEAVLAHLDLHAKHSIGMHFGTFKLTNEAIDTPLKDLQMAKEKLHVTNFTTLIPGESYEH